MILFKSTHSDIKLSVRQAIFKSQPEDGGLFVPEEFPKVDFSSFQDEDFPFLSFKVLKPFFEEIPDRDFLEIVKRAFDFPVKIKGLKKNLFILRLDLGPTLSFKDFGVRFLAQIVAYYLKQERKKIIVLTATSGDTGAAVAYAFWKLENVKVVVLFPEKGVSEFQRKQITTLGENVKAVAIKGSFDECQSLVKQAFLDKELENLNLFSANSINIGRLLPQIAYYFYAALRLLKEKEDREFVFVVPSGNFGNFVAGVYAYFMGLPVFKIIAAVNKNDVFYKFLKTGKYKVLKPPYPTLANAMDIGNPSNLIRLFYHFEGRLNRDGKLLKMPDIERLKELVNAGKALDDDILSIIGEYFRKHKYIPDPHTACGLKVAEDFLKKDVFVDKTFVVLQTANYTKFKPEIYLKAGVDSESLKALDKVFDRKEYYLSLQPDYQKFKDFILNL